MKSAAEERELKRGIYHQTHTGELVSERQTTSLYGSEHIYITCAYCRVSTDSESQLSSYELQREHYEKLADSHPNWDLRHIFADEGISGTSMKKRDDFNAMIAACEAGEYELIVTKSVSRFARNIVDCISLVRRLKQQTPPVGVFFETDNLFTLAEDSELKLSILATIAQEESAKKSESMNWSLEQRFKTGKLLTPAPLGYERPKDQSGNYIKYGALKIVESEAIIVRYIFAAYLSGEPIRNIAKWLTDVGCPTKVGKTVWNEGSINYILSNERYCGHVLTWKTFTSDIYEHTHRKNRKNRNQYIYRDNHPAIVSVEEFNAVQRLMEAHRNGERGALHTTRVVGEGAFKGYIPVDCYWTNEDPTAYYEASDSVAQNSPVYKVKKRAISAFNLDGYQVVNGQFLAKNPECSNVKFSINGIVFNTVSIKKMINATHVQILIHPTERKFAVRPCENQDIYSIKWVDDPTKKITTKTIRSRHFCSMLFQLMDWDPNLIYRICGEFFSYGNKEIIVFDLTDAQPFMSIGKNRNSQLVLNEDWSKDFGVDFYEHETKNIAFRDQSENMKLSAKSVAVQNGNENIVVLPEEVSASKEKIIAMEALTDDK